MVNDEKLITTFTREIFSSMTFQRAIFFMRLTLIVRPKSLAKFFRLFAYVKFISICLFSGFYVYIEAYFMLN